MAQREPAPADLQIEGIAQRRHAAYDHVHAGQEPELQEAPPEGAPTPHGPDPGGLVERQCRERHHVLHLMKMKVNVNMGASAQALEETAQGTATQRPSRSIGVVTEGLP